MEEQNRDALSHYQPTTVINARHGVQLVQHDETGRLFVKKQLKQYNIEVFQMLRAHPVPNTPRIYELVEENGTLTVIEEYLQGQTLQGLLEEHGNFSENEAIAIALAIAGIVQDLHHMEPPIIHRDIKPANLILSPDHVLKLVSFQKAELMLPPQSGTDISGTHSGVQKDIHDIGALLNTLLSGGTAAGVGQTSSLQKLTAEELCIQEHLTAFITKCTKQDSPYAFSNIDELVAELQDMRSGMEEEPDLPEQISGADKESRTETQESPFCRSPEDPGSSQR